MGWLNDIADIFTGAKSDDPAVENQQQANDDRDEQQDGDQDPPDKD